VIVFALDNSELEKKVNRLRPLLDPMGMLRETAQEAQVLIRRNFDREGPGWKSLAPKTQRAREKGWGHYSQSSSEGPAHRILRWTHDLDKSMTERGAKGAVWREGEGWVEFGSDLKVGNHSLADIHHHGRGKMPKRKLYEKREIWAILRKNAGDWRSLVVRTWESL
jgi:hypothetical protein